MTDDEKIELVNGLMVFFGGEYKYGQWMRLATWAFGTPHYSGSPLWPAYEEARGPTHGPDYERRWRIALYDHVLLKRGQHDPRV